MGMEVMMGLLGIGMILSLGAAVGMFLYYRGLMGRMSDTLRDFEQGNPLGKKDVRETRESKLISQLKGLLENAGVKQERALAQKDQTAQLLSDLSHQLKTPLANIVMDMELLQDESLTAGERREFSAHAADQAKKMQWLMKTLIKASRLEQGMISFEGGYANIRDTIAMGIGAVYAQAKQKNISIETEDFEDMQLFHHPKWTAEALANILENAVKYSPRSSHIRLRVVPLDIYTRIEVADEGCGIPKAEFNRIFKRFYRGDAASMEEGGGLGLYLAQLIMEKQRGYITVTSKPGMGSCFHMYLLRQLLA